jgi:hypothetical protein
MKKRSPFQVSYFIQQIAYTHPLDFMCVKNKKEFSVQVKNKPRIGIQNMRLFLVYWTSWWQAGMSKENECCQSVNVCINKMQKE